MAWAPDYTTVTDLKTFTRVTSSADDAVLTLAITAASRAVDQFCNRQFGLVAEPEERSYTAEWDRRKVRWIIPIDDVMIVTGFTAEVEAGELTTSFRPANAAVVGRPYTSLSVDSDSSFSPCGTEDEVTVTARWGWSAVPDAIEQATLMQAARIFARRSSPFGVSGSPDTGPGELRLLARIDADVSVILQPYVRWWAAA